MKTDLLSFIHINLLFINSFILIYLSCVKYFIIVTYIQKKYWKKIFFNFHKDNLWQKF